MESVMGTSCRFMQKLSWLLEFIAAVVNEKKFVFAMQAGLSVG